MKRLSDRIWLYILLWLGAACSPSRAACVAPAKLAYVAEVERCKAEGSGGFEGCEELPRLMDEFQAAQERCDK